MPFITETERSQALTVAAASDANHDFKKPRGTSATNDFIQWFTTKFGQNHPEFQVEAAYTSLGIGTPLTPEKSFTNEWQCFQYLTNLSKMDILEKMETGESSRLEIDETTMYDWSSIHLGTKNNSEEYEWSLKGTELLDWIQGPDAKHIPCAFLMDAVSVRFYEAFKDVLKGEDEARTVYMLIPRECINDAANTVNLDALEKYTANSGLIVKQLYDTQSYDVVYPSLVTTDSKLPTKYQFNSSYNVSLGLHTTKENLKEVTLKFFNHETVSDPIRIQRSAIEEKHPNSVNALFKPLIEAFKGADSVKFHTTLQQKRTGDWLQVLASLEPHRFPELTANHPVFLCTQDILCAAYGLMVGANVLFTTRQDVDGKTQNNLTVFRKKTDTVIDTEALLKNQIRLRGLQPNTEFKLGDLHYAKLLEIYSKKQNEFAMRLKKTLQNGVERLKPIIYAFYDKKRIHNEYIDQIQIQYMGLLAIGLKAADTIETFPVLQQTVKLEDGREMPIPELLNMILVATGKPSDSMYKLVKQALSHLDTNLGILDGLFTTSEIRDLDTAMETKFNEIQAQPHSYLNEIGNFLMDTSNTLHISGYVHRLQRVLEPSFLAPLIQILKYLEGPLFGFSGPTPNTILTNVTIILYILDDDYDIQAAALEPNYRHFLIELQTTGKTLSTVAIQRLLAKYKVKAISKSAYFTDLLKKGKKAFQALASRGGARTVASVRKSLGDFKRTQLVKAFRGVSTEELTAVLEEKQKQLNTRASHPVQTFLQGISRGLFGLYQYLESVARVEEGESVPVPHSLFSVLTFFLAVFDSLHGIPPLKESDDIRITILAIVEALILQYFPNIDSPEYTLITDFLDGNFNDTEEIQEFFRTMNAELYGQSEFPPCDIALKDPMTMHVLGMFLKPAMETRYREFRDIFTSDPSLPALAALYQRLEDGYTSILKHLEMTQLGGATVARRRSKKRDRNTRRRRSKHPKS